MSKIAPHVGEAVVKRGLAKVGKTHTPGMCQKEIRQLFGVPSAGDYDKDGDADAHDAWKSATAKGRVVRNRDVKQAPRGAYLYFSGGKHGHVALGLGGDSCVSTDAAGGGVWGRAKISDLAKRWNRPYEGYIVVTGNQYQVLEEPKAKEVLEVMKHTHIAKPKKPLVIKGTWTDVTGVIKGKERKRFYALDAKGRLTVRAYFPGKWSGRGMGRLQFRVVREPIGLKLADPTGYDERILLASKSHRLSFAYEGKAEPLRRYKVQARVLGGGTFTTTGTHYVDFWQTV